MSWLQDKLQSDHQPSTRGQEAVEKLSLFILALQEQLAPWICPVGSRLEPVSSPCPQQVVLSGNCSSGLSTRGIVAILFLCVLALFPLFTGFNGCFLAEITEITDLLARYRIISHDNREAKHKFFFRTGKCIFHKDKTTPSQVPTVQTELSATNSFGSV